MLRAVINASETQSGVKLRIEAKVTAPKSALTDDEQDTLVKQLGRRIANALPGLLYTDFGIDNIDVTFDK